MKKWFSFAFNCNSLWHPFLQQRLCPFFNKIEQFSSFNHCAVLCTLHICFWKEKPSWLFGINKNSHESFPLMYFWCKWSKRSPLYKASPGKQTIHIIKPISFLSNQTVRQYILSISLSMWMRLTDPFHSLLIC